jgi:HK97 family phage major capsid protein
MWKQFSLFAFLFTFGLRASVAGDDDGGGDATEFQTKALGSLDLIEKSMTKQKTALEQVTANLDRVDKETKKALTDLEAMRTSTNTSIETMVKQLKAVSAAIGKEAMNITGNPIKRIQANEELRTRMNVAVRLAMDKGGDMARVVEPMVKAIGEGTTPGSTYINTQLMKEIYDTLATYGVWNTFGVRNMGTRITRMPVKTARPIAQFILTEGGTLADDTNKAGTEVSLQVEVIAVLLKVSLQLLQDSEFDVTADVLDDFSEAYAQRLDYMTLLANGTADGNNGGMTGAFGASTAVTAVTTHTSVAKLTLDDFVTTIATVDPIVLSRKARWWIHPQLLAKVMLIKDLNGRPIFMNALEAPAFGGIGSILGYPVTMALAAPSTDAISSQVALFGDGNAQVVGMRSDYVFESSDQFAWNTLQRTFRGWGRAGTKNRKANAMAVLSTSAT